MRLSVLVAALQVAPFAAAVKDWMFRKCDQNPFCRRNRLYADEARVPDFESPYQVAHIDSNDPTRITGDLEKAGSETVFPFVLEITTDSMVHLLVDEAGRAEKLSQMEGTELLNPERYSPAGIVLDQSRADERHPDTQPSVKSGKDSLEVEFGDDNKVVVDFNPFQVTLFRHGEPQIALNKHKGMNIEELRLKPADLSAQPEEVQAAWKDTFDGHTDNKVRGPESIALDTTFEGYGHVYGIPEHADRFALKDTHTEQVDPYRLFNVDIFEYETESPLPMYGSIPFMVAHKPGGSAGVFWLNAADTYIDIDKHDHGSATTAHWISETGKMDVWLMVGDHPSDVLSSYSLITGAASLPQLFTTAYHQCRWNYNTQSDLLDVNHQFDIHDIPYDVIWLDIDYTIRRKYFTWNHDLFPDPEQMMLELDKTRRKLVTIIDPHIKVESGYEVYEAIRDNDIGVRDKDGKQFQGHCWPGNSVWIDTMDPSSWPYWSEFYGQGKELGGRAPNLHIWNDMSEPSVFSGSETTAYKDLLHYDGFQHRDVHGVYGQTVTNATYEALIDRYDHQQRPFILTRSFYAGSQKLAAMWTGDNQAEWSYLQAATPMVLTLGIAGMPFAGADVGGFFRDPPPELLTRWYQSGAFYPFFRGHAHIDAKRREPYLPAPPYNQTIAEAIELRYSLLPEFYTAFWQASKTLAPVMRPLLWEDPTNPDLYNVDDQFMIGSSLMAKPVTTEGATSIDVVAPQGHLWYDYFSGTLFKGGSVDVDLQTIPLYVKGGSVVFRKDRKRRSAELMANDPYTLVVAADADGKAQGEIYVDDGVSFDYETKGDYLVAHVELADGKLKGTVDHAASGPFKNLRIERIVVYGTEVAQARLADGAALDVTPYAHGFTIRNPAVAIGSDWEILL